MSLKRATSGGQKGSEEILSEIHDSIPSSVSSHVDLIFSLMNRATSPLVRGTETKMIKLCYLAFVSVFFESSRLEAVPLEIATDFFLNVVESHKDVLSEEDSLYQANGRQGSKLVPEILGSLGIFNITQHTTQSEGTKVKESSIFIDHELIREFGLQLRNDPSLANILDVDNVWRSWNSAYVQAYFAQKAKVCLSFLITLVKNVFLPLRSVSMGRRPPWAHQAPCSGEDADAHAKSRHAGGRGIPTHRRKFY